MSPRWRVLLGIRGVDLWGSTGQSETKARECYAKTRVIPGTKVILQRRSDDRKEWIDVAVKGDPEPPVRLAQYSSLPLRPILPIRVEPGPLLLPRELGLICSSLALGLVAGLLAALLVLVDRRPLEGSQVIQARLVADHAAEPRTATYPAAGVGALRFRAERRDREEGHQLRLGRWASVAIRGQFHDRDQSRTGALGRLRYREPQEDGPDGCALAARDRDNGNALTPLPEPQEFAGQLG